MNSSHDHLDRRGVAWGTVGVAIVIALTFIGSDRLVWFDAALVGYLFGVVFAVFGVAYRYAVWLRRPPTAMLHRRGWDAFRQRKTRNVVALPSLVATQLLTQGFIRRRSRSRWLAHRSLRPNRREMASYYIALALHILGATIWAGDHLVLGPASAPSQTAALTQASPKQRLHSPGSRRTRPRPSPHGRSHRRRRSSRVLEHPNRDLP